MPQWRSPLAKVHRALSLCEELAAAQAKLRERQAEKTTLVGENNADAWNDRKFWAQWRFVPHEPVPEDWPAIIGDVLHNLRGALDHVVWHLTSKHLGHEPPRPTQILFPIALEQEKLTTGGSKITLESMDPGARAVIEAAQPFHADVPDAHPLAVLKYLSDRDKHRAIHVVRSAAYKVQVDIDPMPFDLRQMVPPGVFLEGDVVARIEYNRHHGYDVREVVARPQVEYGESIKVSDDSPYLPIGDVLQGLVDQVTDLLADLAPYV